MPAISSISLRIYGGAQSSGLDVQPLVSVGSAPDGFKPTPPTIIDEQQAWMITHAQSYTLYTVSSKKCLTSDGQPGQLLICLFLPVQQRLADGNSPLGLLDSLMDCFAVQALREGKLPSAEIDNSSFKMLLDRYRLEQRPMLLPVMQGHEPAAICVENKSQLDALMRHSRYPVLSGVGRLELGFHCKSTIVLTSQARTQPQEAKPQRMHIEPKVERATQSNPRSAISGGLPLGDEIIVEPNTPWYKKLSGIAAIMGGVIVLLIGVLMFAGDDDEQPVAVDEPKSQEVIMADNNISRSDPSATTAKEVNLAENTQRNEQARAEEKKDEAKATEAAKREEAKATANEAKKEADRQAREEAAKKAKENAAREAEEKAEKKAAASNWQAAVLAKAQSCPIQLRLGVRITSISVTDNSVTYNVKYEELSKYDMDEDDRNGLAQDRSNILKNHASGIPSNVRISVIQKDKAGRAF